MDHVALRAYAVRGLTARLTELDSERARVVDLLTTLGEGPEAVALVAPAAALVTRPRRAPRPANRDATLPVPDGPASGLSYTAACELLPDDAPVVVEREEARVLPRRRPARVSAPVEPAPPALPPMPRLVKARAS